jgi:hypothetical protein
MEMTLSIGFSPAAAAGVPGRPSQVVAVAASVTGTTHWATEATREPCPVSAVPWMVTMPVSRVTAISKFMSGPPSMTATFLGVLSR